METNKSSRPKRKQAKAAAPRKESANKADGRSVNKSKQPKANPRPAHRGGEKTIKPAELSHDELKALTQTLFDDPDRALELTDEELLAVRRHNSAYGNVITAEESYANLSLINWRDEFMKRFHMMSLTGFLFRMLEEYTDKDELKRIRAKYSKKIRAVKAAATTEVGTTNEVGTVKAVADLEQARDAELVACTAGVRKTVEKFLQRNFEYNPDRHVREAGRGGDDVEVRLEKMATAAAAKKADTATAASSASLLDTTRLLAATSARCCEVIESAQRIAKRAGADDEATILSRKLAELRKSTVDMAAVNDLKSAADVLPALSRMTPADTLYNYGRYITNNYTRLREAYAALYREQPDIEASIIYYNSFPTEAAARDHRVQHADEFKAEVITVANNGITMLGPFKENTERIDFYNKNTEIIKQMMEQMEKDHRLGKDLMEKKVQRKKAAAVRKDGPDAPGLAAYSRTAGAVASGLTGRADADKVAADVAAAKKRPDDKSTGDKSTDKSKGKDEAIDNSAADDDVPDNAVQVDVFRTVDGKMEKSKFFTQAEAPVHMKSASQKSEAPLQART